MSKFIKNANLPQEKVTSLICGKMNDILIDYFATRKIQLFFTRTNPYVDESISEHCDITALYLGGGKILIEKNQREFISELSKTDIEVIESRGEVKGIYPRDILLNQILIGQYHIGKISCCDKAIIDQTADFSRLNVKQGYAKCSCLVVDENSVITDDLSIHRKILENGFISLLISKGDILLKGQEYGFIGGASGKLSKDEIVFFGDIKKHRDYLKIKEFLDERKINIIYFDFPLTDFGGIIPIKEKRLLD